MSKRQLTVRYILFYILFLPDSWQILAGLIAAWFLAPLVELPEAGFGGRAVLFIMLVAIGYAAFRMPARWITRSLVKWILGEKRP